MIAVGLTLALVTTATAARAQYGEAAARCGVSAGAFLPIDGDTADAFGSTWWSVALTYDLPASAMERHRFGLGWIQSPGNSLRLGNTVWDWEFRMVPLTYTYLHLPRGGAAGFFLGGGGGVYFTRTELETITPLATGVQDDTQTRFGLHVVAGYAFNSRLAAEARFTKLFEDDNDSNLDGVTLSLAGRF